MRSLLLLLALAAALTAQGAAPRLEAGATGWNFGTVNQGDEKDHAISLKNVGGADLKIIRLDVTCGCIIPTLLGRQRNLVTAKDPIVVAAGAEIKLDLHLDARRTAFGDIKKEVILETNEPGRSKVELVMEGTIKPVWWVKDINVNLGKLTSGVETKRTFRVFRQQGMKVKMQQVLSDPAELKPEAAEFTDADGTAGWEITVTFPKNRESGHFEGLVLMQTDFTPVPQQGVRVFAEVEGAVRLEPQQLNFGILKAGETKTLKLRVVKEIGEGMEVAFVECKDARMKTKITTKKVGVEFEIEATFTADQAEGSFKGDLMVVVNEPGQRQYPVLFYGRIGAP